MKLLLIMSSVIFVQADTSCDGVVFNNICHEKEVLKCDLSGLFNLALDPELDNLYFSYYSDYRTAAKFNIVTKELQDIEGAEYGFSPSVNLENHEVFIGSPKGIYKYYPNSNKVDFYAANNTYIFHTVYFKDTLYYNDWPDRFLYVISNGETTRYEDLKDIRVGKFTFDNDDNIFFTNGSGIYSQKTDKDTIKYEFYGSADIRELAVDAKGDVYACHADGVFIVNRLTKILENVFEVNCYGIVFDRDNNVIYSDGDSDSLVRLKPKKAERYNLNKL